MGKGVLVNDVTTTVTNSVAERMMDAVRQTAPGTALRHALDMIIAGHLGALICIGDTDNVIASGGDGFNLDISFTANRLFELSKMDGAIVVDRGLTQILRANYHLNPDPTLPTSETGMRHRTAARMSLLTQATVISVSERRQVVTVYVDGHAHQLRPVGMIMGVVNQLLVSLQNTRGQLDRALLRLTTLELDNYVTVADIAQVFYLFEVLMTIGDELAQLIVELGSEGRSIRMQREEFIGDMSDTYTLLIRDYAADSSIENAAHLRKTFRETANLQLRNARRVAELLGYEGYGDDSVLTPLGLRTLNNVSVVRKGVADKIVDEYGGLGELMADIQENPKSVDRLDDLGVDNPTILADTLYRMWGKQA